MGSATILWGVKLSIATLDAFLEANKVRPTYGNPPLSIHHPDEDPISALLYAKVAKVGGADIDKSKFRVVIPSRECFESIVAYVTYDWVMSRCAPFAPCHALRALRRQRARPTTGSTQPSQLAACIHTGDSFLSLTCARASAMSARTKRLLYL